MPKTTETPIVPRHEALVTLVETMTAGLLGSDMEGIVRFANPRLLGWLGYAWARKPTQTARSCSTPGRTRRCGTTSSR